MEAAAPLKKSSNAFMARQNLDEHDFYPTPDFATEQLLKRETFEGG